MKIDKSEVCKKYLKKVGKTVRVVREDGSEDTILAVIGQVWKKNKSRFENLSSKIGLYYKDYYTYIGPYDCDITALTENDYLECNGKKYFVIRSEAVIVGDKVQYYDGVLKRIVEENENVFDE
jgi:hypothetical protein